MVVDEHGVGQSVQHSLMETNSDWHMLYALRHFVRAHPICETELRVVMVDKDLNEIRVIGSHFPLVQVLICTFHVKKYLALVSRKPVYDRISADDHAALDDYLHFCVYAKSPEDYAQRLEDLRSFCDRVHFGSFFTYYKNNWDNCKPMWVEFYRQKLPFIRMNTNNHLESFFGKFKENLKDGISMSECLEELFARERRRENELRFTSDRIGTYVNNNYHDQEMKNLLRFTTHFVAENVAREYACAKSKTMDYTYDIEEDGCFVQVQGRVTGHRLNAKTFTCSCTFATNMKLPCRHAMVCRIHTDAVPVIPLEAVDLRWSRNVQNVPRAVQFAYKCHSEPQPASQPTPRSRKERYNEAMRALQPLCSKMGEISDEDVFSASLNFIKDQWYNARLRMRLPVEPREESQQGDEHGSDDDEARDEGSDDDDGGGSGGGGLSEADGENGDENMGGGEIGDGGQNEGCGENEERGENDDAPMLLSQAHSLYSEELGRVRVLATRDISFPQPVREMGVVKPRRSLALKELPEGYSDEEEERGTDCQQPPTPPPIHFNQRVSSVCRPQLNREEVASAVRQNRVLFNATSQARRANGSITLAQLLRTLADEKPSLDELRKRLVGVMERNKDLEGCRPTYLKQRNPIVIDDIFYFLPEALLNKCFKILPLANQFDDANSVASSQPSTQSQSASQGDERDVEVVKIKNLLFRRGDIETMEKARQLKEAAEHGLDVVRWLRVEVAPSVPAELQTSVSPVAAHVARMYPAYRVQDLRVEVFYEMLWHFQPHAWFNDAIILGFLERLSDQFATFGATSVHRTSPPPTPTLVREFTARVRDEVYRCCFDENVKTFAIPVLFGAGNGSHWMCIIIDKSSSTAIVHDSMNADQMLNAMASLVSQVPSKTPWKVQRSGVPLQFDGYSCGFYACLKVWRHVDEEFERDSRDLNDTTLRFKLLGYLLNHGST